MKHIAYIGVGSNLGDRLESCKWAISHIERMDDTTILKESEWRHYPALTKNEEGSQPDFVNGVIKIETNLEAEELLDKLQIIETVMGREADRTKWAPRIIDLDILFFDEENIVTTRLTVPHPELHERIFVLEPLCDIDPELIHPKLGETVDNLLNKVKEAK